VLRTGIIVICILSSIVFLEIVFHGIVGHTCDDLGTFGGFHTAIWQWARFAGTELREMWDILGRFIIRGTEVLTELLIRLCRICGVRDDQERSQGEGDLGQAGDGIKLQVQVQASSPPPYSHVINFQPLYGSHSLPDNDFEHELAV